MADDYITTNDIADCEDCALHLGGSVVLVTAHGWGIRCDDGYVVIPKRHANTLQELSSEELVDLINTVLTFSRRSHSTHGVPVVAVSEPTAGAGHHLRLRARAVTPQSQSSPVDGGSTGPSLPTGLTV